MRAKHFVCARYGTSKMHLSTPSQTQHLGGLGCCWFLCSCYVVDSLINAAPILCGGSCSLWRIQCFVLVFVIHYFVSFLVLQSFCRGED